MGIWGLAHSLYGTEPTAGAGLVRALPFSFACMSWCHVCMYVCVVLGSIPSLAYMLTALQLPAMCLTLVGIPGLFLFCISWHHSCMH